MTAEVIEAERLTKTFGSDRGINDVNLTITAGEVVGFLGPNGAGKSTTIRCLLGLMRPTKGVARVLQTTPGDPAALAAIGYLPGELNLPEALTGGDLLKRVARIRGLTDLSYRDELISRFGVELGRPLRKLSKGNKQKIGIVAAFMHRPDLLILDEPTSGLDPLLQDEFASVLRENAAAGRTVFLSSHDLGEVQRLAGRVVVIKDGEVIVDDSVEALRARSPHTIELTLPTEDTTPELRALAAVDGVVITHRSGAQLRLTYTGPLTPVLATIVPLYPVTMTARPADLEDLFLGMYGRHPAAVEGDDDGG